ncbi:MAG TPA: glycoside hydrolase family 38 C-terminal domain-containing protein [Mobilitalea sp.]|nr:glycoside hydrolase family 38 C-terminal domain-containing protein [Mobilitalea sp.]
MLRQILHGKRFFKEEFGKESIILWLPDVFGYSAALPQIMNKCGIKYFMTTKISWNEFNKMPYDTFLWEGIDGTRILTHFISTRDYHTPRVEDGYRTERYTTYNGFINPTQVMGAWERYNPKYLNDEILMSFGYGDGGGGPTKEMLENQRRLSAGIPGCPQTVMSTARNFFEKLERDVKDNKYLPAWVGELYLEYHRGTYTSMARNKKYNRRSEFAYQDVELYATLDRFLAGNSYPADTILEAWEVILRNQFHDILPGSSIMEVYEESQEEYRKILKTNNELKETALKHIADKVDAPRYSVIVFNPNSSEGNDIVAFQLPDDAVQAAVYDNDVRLPAQYDGEGNVIFKADKVPAKGYKTFELRKAGTDINDSIISDFALKSDNLNISVSESCMENQYFRIKFNSKGQFSAIFDKMANRNVLKEGEYGNVIMSYEDKPHNYDAWDVNNYYIEKSWEIDQLDHIEVVENGPVRATVRLDRTYLDSRITQYISIYQDIPRIDIKNEIDWKEKQIFVRTLFPVDIHTNEATFDIQYGNVKRPTHYNTSWDFAKFEVCAHKWIDVSEDDYGISVINDCKYGCSVHDGVIGLSMLKSAIYPNPEADKEHHEFSYSLFPHRGDFRQAGTVKAAYQFNNPMTAVMKENETGELAQSYSFVSSDSENVVIEVVKKAEDSDDTIVRVYECYNRRTDAVLTFAKDIKQIHECSMLEEEEAELSFVKNKVSFIIRPFEIKTFKVRFA